jgi:hypothetical protein
MTETPNLKGRPDLNVDDLFVVEEGEDPPSRTFLLNELIKRFVDYDPFHDGSEGAKLKAVAWAEKELKDRGVT